ncbi:hypothetical protein CWB76_08945 [Pseudoalteromonas sp. S1609]|uniref:hypothetical protein n=1 Tax=Pseudoalteromonas sp. S1609 TaxID=579505 RepID=UPI00110AA307|nr:hypothetical protein [Pseudoalteromonas sp. S1609]TMP70806.1 hypothetical protein CWB76_08945 [Pseudoalteromonas sp. S1609]
MKGKIITSILNQGILSVFNLLISIYLIRILSFESFGQYSLIFAIGMTLISFQNSLIVTPMAIRTKKRVLNGFSKYINFYNTIELLYLVVASFIAFFITIYSQLSLIAVGLYLVSFCLREYIKSLLLIDFNVRKVFFLDVVFISLSLLLLFLNKLLYQITPNSVLLLLGLASLCAALIPLLYLKLKLTFSIIKVYRFYSVKIWSIAKWSSIGVLITEIHSRLYIVVLTAFYSAEILGLVQAARVFFGPLNLLINGWIRVARNHLASLVGTNSLRKFGQFYTLSIICVVFLNVFILFLIYFTWAFVEDYLFSDAKQEMFLTVFLWGLCVAIIQLRMVTSTALQAFDVFKIQTLFNLVASLSTVISMTFIIIFFDWRYVPLSIAFGELVLLIMSYIYLNKLKRVQSA